jgi:hypothetical protein
MRGSAVLTSVVQWSEVWLGGLNERKCSVDKCSAVG